ncbi:citrate lyase subunit beta/citryl-CoA lyase [Haloactinopolyspora alba]|uniref:Citrate lyase subunit beta/citryl-CoA lyase n=1 Tax=Haloactinopolyspora alba TaxID=648780 RepID=A0A2P8E9I4_9ACTN|nr:CoA ester lyase [Haloactinopolyspora alba]PSL06136.1 citrate lyase subunit beta/citryl-CoA lyase [Haloactinopolyspora alba]
MTVTLTQLYVPADRADRAHKAMASSADVVILDLEDAVAPAAKVPARDAVPEIVAAFPGRPVQVRVNAASSPWGAADLAMVATLPATVGVRVPKVAVAADVNRVRDAVGGRDVHGLIETAAGVENAGELARTPGVASIALGEADLRSDLGISADEGLAWCRQRVVVAARAVGLPAPAMAVYTDLNDLEGLAESSRRGRRLGFVGRAAIHPKQLPVIEAAFAPDDGEVARAREVIAAVEEAQAVGDGTAVLPDGAFLDVAMVDQARRILTLAARARE